MKRKCAVPLFVLLAFGMATAYADPINVLFEFPLVAGFPGETVTFTGGLFNNTGVDLFISGAGVNLAGFNSGDIDLSGFILNATGPLPFGAFVAPVDFLVVTIPNSFPAGLYGGTFTVQGGATSNEDGILGSLPFTVQVNAVPEPGSLLMALPVLGALFIFRSGKAAGAGFPYGALTLRKTSAVLPIDRE